jgi:hypothetical protein
MKKFLKSSMKLIFFLLALLFAYALPTEQEDPCPLCFDEMTENEPKLSCGHMTHAKCLRQIHASGDRRCLRCLQETIPDDIDGLVGEASVEEKAELRKIKARRASEKLRGFEQVKESMEGIFGNVGDVDVCLFIHDVIQDIESPKEIVQEKI